MTPPPHPTPPPNPTGRPARPTRATRSGAAPAPGWEITTRVARVDGPDAEQLRGEITTAIRDLLTWATRHRGGHHNVHHDSDPAHDPDPDPLRPGEDST